MPYVISSACIDIKDKSCIEECPVDCIYEGNRMMYINQDECIDCGACMPVCPTEAIYWEDDLPESEKKFKRINTEFFIPIGNLQGARNQIDKDMDHPEVKDT
jgi:NAD-dependent dihydropyrimidine dehydrogenase PreA subunit